MTFAITTLNTTQIQKVEFKSNPDFSNISFDGYGPSGETLLVLNVPAAIGSTLAVVREFGPGAGRSLYVDVKEKPAQVGGAYFEAAYAGRIEVR